MKIIHNKKGAWSVRSGTIYMAFSYTLTTLFIFGFQMIAARFLKPDHYGLVSVLYSSVVFVSLFLGQTFEFTLSKFLSENEANGKNSFVVIQRILIWQISTLIIFIIIAMVFKNTIIKGLFPEVPEFFYLFVACGIFYSIEISLKGVMRGTRDIGYFGTLIVSQNFLRIIYLLLLVGVMRLGLIGAGLSILFASITNLLIILIWYQKSWRELKGEEYDLQGILNFRQLGEYILPTMAMFGFSTYFYNTGPSFIKLLGGESANEKAGLFLIAVMISRLPLQLSEALSINLLPNMSRLIVLGDWRGIRYYIVKSYQLFIPLLLISMVGVSLLSPLAFRIIYPEFTYDLIGLNVLLLATGVIMLVAAFIQFLLAFKKVTNVVIGWLSGGIVMTLIIFLMSGDILTRLETGYLIGAITIWFCMALFAFRAINEMKAIGISRKEELLIS